VLALFFLRYNNYMTNEDILEKQVEALEKLLQLRSAIIEELEAKLSKLENDIARANTLPYVPGVSIPWVGPPQWMPQQPFIGGAGGSSITISSTCPDGSSHQFPQYGLSAGSQCCSKCGQYNLSGNGTVTVGGSGMTSIQNLQPGGAGNIQTTGYMQPVDPMTGNVYTLTNVVK
jgi:hypothetical protein